MAKKGVYFRIEEDVYSRLKERAEREGLKISKLLEKLIMMYLEEGVEHGDLGGINERLDKIERSLEELRMKVDINARRVTVLERKLRKLRKIES